MRVARLVSRSPMWVDPGGSGRPIGNREFPIVLVPGNHGGIMPVGPSLADLSPLKQKQPRLQFPVLPNLRDDLVQAVTHPVGNIAYALAVCSGYAYSDADTVAMIMARMGLFDNHCAEVRLSDDAMFIDSTAYLVQSDDGRAVILSYRGTSPVNFIDWLLDADLDPERISLM